MLKKLRVLLNDLIDEKRRKAQGSGHKAQNAKGDIRRMSPFLSNLFKNSANNSPAYRLCGNWQNDSRCFFVIPGLIRNPVQFQALKFLDAGSSPARQARIRHFFEL